MPSPGDLPHPWIELGLLSCKQIPYGLNYKGSTIMLYKILEGKDLPCNTGKYVHTLS